MTFLSAFLQPRQDYFWLPILRVIAGALPLHYRRVSDYRNTPEWVVSSMMFGAAVGALSAAALLAGS